MTYDDDLKSCAELVQKGDPDRFLATMAAPVKARAILFPLYAMNVEVSRAPWVTQEPMIAEMRLQWWRDVVEEIAKGGAVRRHHVATPLARGLSVHLAECLDEYVAVRRWDIYKDPFEGLDHFENYIMQSAGTLMLVAAQSLGPADEEVVLDFGYASGVANWLRAIPELEARGRIPLVDGTTKGVQVLAQQALDRLNAARARRHLVSNDAAPALLAGWQTCAVLKQAIAQPERVAAGALGLSEFGRRTRLMWGAATGFW